MPVCEHEIRETKRGAGPCRIVAEVKLRNGKPNWWCHTHGVAAGAPDGNPLTQCPGAWMDAVPEEECLEIDVNDGEFSVWGGMDAALEIGETVIEPGKVHVHHRSGADQPKDVDQSFSIVTLRAGSETLVIEGTAAVAFSVSELVGREVVPLKCTHCGEVHIDELMFATHPHAKHLCNSCGRNFRHPAPTISNPLAEADKQLGLSPRPEPVRPSRPLEIDSTEFGGISLFPSNAAIVSNMSRSEEMGIHVHAWDHEGVMVLDETYSSVVIDGQAVDEEFLRVLAVQRSLAHGAPIIAKDCQDCGAALCGPRDTYFAPTTTHICHACGAQNKTRRRVFLNPLVDQFPV